jgi:hypothetical protein
MKKSDSLLMISQLWLVASFWFPQKPGMIVIGGIYLVLAAYAAFKEL